MLQFIRNGKRTSIPEEKYRLQQLVVSEQIYIYPAKVKSNMNTIDFSVKLNSSVWSSIATCCDGDFGSSLGKLPFTRATQIPTSVAMRWKFSTHERYIKFACSCLIKKLHRKLRIRAAEFPVFNATKGCV